MAKIFMKPTMTFFSAKLKNKPYLVSLLSLGLTLSACNTPRFSEDKELEITRMQSSKKATRSQSVNDKKKKPEHPKTDEAGLKTEVIKTQDPKSETTKPEPAKKIDEKDQMRAFYIRLKATPTISSEDEKYIIQLTQYLDLSQQKDELNKAIMIVAWTKLFLKQTDRSDAKVPQVEIKAVDKSTEGKTEAQEKKAPMYEAFLHDKTKVDLVSELKNNLLLQTPDVYMLILSALEHKSEREGLSRHIYSLLREKLSKWREADSKYAALFASETSTLSASSTSASPTSTPVPVAVAPKVEPVVSTQTAVSSDTQVSSVEGVDDSSVAEPSKDEPVSLMEGQDILDQAQKLMDKNNYKATVTLLRTVTPKHPQSAMAKIKLKEACNRAVRELRNKAAKAFASAMPISDVQIRKNYLNQASQHLTMALTLYGESDQIPAVKENLSVVTKNLEQLK